VKITALMMSGSADRAGGGRGFAHGDLLIGAFTLPLFQPESFCKRLRLSRTHKGHFLLLIANQHLLNSRVRRPKAAYDSMHGTPSPAGRAKKPDNSSVRTNVADSENLNLFRFLP